MSPTAATPACRSSVPRVSRLSSFGSNGTANGQFKYPRGIDMDPDGSVWVVDSVRAVVQHFTAGGAYLGKLTASPGTGVGQLNTPFGVAVDGARVYVVDTPAASVKVFDKGNGAYLQALGGKGVALGQTEPTERHRRHRRRLHVHRRTRQRTRVCVEDHTDGLTRYSGQVSAARGITLTKSASKQHNRDLRPGCRHTASGAFDVSGSG